MPQDCLRGRYLYLVLVRADVLYDAVRAEVCQVELLELELVQRLQGQQRLRLVLRITQQLLIVAEVHAQQVLEQLQVQSGQLEPNQLNQPLLYHRHPIL